MLALEVEDQLWNDWSWAGGFIVGGCGINLNGELCYWMAARWRNVNKNEWCCCWMATRLRSVFIFYLSLVGLHFQLIKLF